jgi:hypothetical protein
MSFGPQRPPATRVKTNVESFAQAYRLWPCVKIRHAEVSGSKKAFSNARKRNRAGWPPDLFECGHVSARSGPTSIRICCCHRRTARPVQEADGSINRRGFARGSAIPGLCGKCADGRSGDAGCRGHIGPVPRGYVALASHGGGCKRGGRDQCSRQKFERGHSISPLDMKANSVWLLYRDGAMTSRSKSQFLTSFQRRVKSARLAMARDQLGILNRFLIEKLPVGDHC